MDVVASDHAPKAKKITDPFFEAAFGSAQTETMLTVTYDEGVNTGRITPSRLVQLLCENPARIFGLYPAKGILQPGADADVVLFDPNLEHTIRRDALHSGAPYTVLEGRTCLGKPILTLQRGKVIAENGEMKGKVGDARFLPTRISRDPLR
jgi:dihydropyrimidinase